MAITYVKDIPDFNKKVNELTDITDVKDDIEDIQEDVTEIQGDITTLAGAVTALEDEVDSLATVASTGDYDDLSNKPTINNVKILSGTFNISGTAAEWTNYQVTFAQPFTVVPFVAVFNTNHERTNDWGSACVDNITTSGFRVSWWNRTGSEDFIWQAIGY